jgi:hypothetical protein
MDRDISNQGYAPDLVVTIELPFVRELYCNFELTKVWSATLLVQG